MNWFISVTVRVVLPDDIGLTMEGAVADIQLCDVWGRWTRGNIDDDITTDEFTHEKISLREWVGL